MMYYTIGYKSGGSMAGPLEATVVLAKCSKTKKLFGMRVEKREKQWDRTWAFAIDETKAKNEGFFANKVNLAGTDSDYPGCPYCKDGGYGKCTCDKIGCLGSLEKREKGKPLYTCPWCGRRCEMDFYDTIDVSGGGY